MVDGVLNLHFTAASSCMRTDGNEGVGDKSRQAGRKGGGNVKGGWLKHTCNPADLRVAEGVACNQMVE